MAPQDLDDSRKWRAIIIITLAVLWECIDNINPTNPNKQNMITKMPWPSWLPRCMNAPPKQIVSGDGWGKAQVFPPPSFLSSTGLSHQGANAAQIHPSPAPTNFTLPHPPLSLSSHPPHQFPFIQKICHTHVSSPPHLIFTRPHLLVL